MSKLLVPSEDAIELYQEQGTINGLRHIQTDFYETWRWGNKYQLVIQDVLTEQYYATIVSQQEGDHWWLSLEEEGPTTYFHEVEKVPLTTYVYKRISNAE